MAIGIQNFTNVDTSDPTNYPSGQIKDDTGAGDGTPVNVETNGDIQQFFTKLLELAGITASGDPDNETNGYQLIQALTNFNSLSITGGEWVAANNVAFTANNDPVGSYTSITYTYNKYKFFGKTLVWQLSTTGTIAGSPTSFVIAAPSALSALDVDWVANGFTVIGLYNGTATLLTTLGGAFGPGELTVSLVGGGAFTNAGSQTMQIYVIGETFLNP